MIFICLIFLRLSPSIAGSLCDGFVETELSATVCLFVHFIVFVIGASLWLPYADRWSLVVSLESISFFFCSFCSITAVRVRVKERSYDFCRLISGLCLLSMPASPQPRHTYIHIINVLIIISVSLAFWSHSVPISVSTTSQPKRTHDGSVFKRCFRSEVNRLILFLGFFWDRISRRDHPLNKRYRKSPYERVRWPACHICIHTHAQIFTLVKR